MITGKDVYEAARPHIVKHGFEDLDWEDFVPEAQDFYVELAERLNKAHIAPLQGRIDELEEQERQILAQAKVALADVHILVEKYKSLELLVRDFADLIDGDDLDLERIGMKRDALFERARTLCGDES